MKNGGRAIAYIRVSVVGDRAARGRFESPDLQRAAIDGWCEQHGVTVVEEVRDLNRSGGTLTRPGLVQALAIIEAGGADGIVVARSDRASRRTLHGLSLVDDLERRGGWIVATDGTIDTTTRVGRLATTMNFAIAQSELERYTEQSAEVHRRAVMDKGRAMGPAPFGYLRDEESNRLTRDPERAPWVVRVFEWRADGAGWSEMARRLRAAGVTHTSGRTLTTTYLARMVRRRTYVGEASHGQWMRAGSHEPLVSEALWQAANNATPAVSSRGLFVGEKHPESLLRGSLRCAGCRYAMKRLPGERDRPPRWACRTVVPGYGATHECVSPARLTGLQGVAIESEVVGAMFRLVGERAFAGGDQEWDVGALERRRVEAAALLDELSSVTVRRDLGAERWGRMVGEARDELERVERDLADAHHQSARGAVDQASLRQVWDAAGAQERGELLRSVVQAVMIDGNRVAGVIPVWEPVDVPRRGVRGFVARAWPD